MSTMNSIQAAGTARRVAVATQPAAFDLFAPVDRVVSGPVTDTGLYQGQPQQATPAVELFADTPSETASPPSAHDAATLEAQAWVQHLVQLPVDSTEFERQLEAFKTLGRKETNEFMRVSQRVLGQAMADRAGSAAENKVGEQLTALREELGRMDPSHAFGMLHSIPVLGKLFASKVRPEYIKDFQAAQTHIESITMHLYGGQDGLRKDYILLDQQRGHIHSLTEKLALASAVAQAADEEMTRQIADVARTDPVRAEALQNEGLFYIRQKVQDLSTQMAVNAQAELVYGILRDNNKQLLHEVDRTTQTAVAALQVGVTAKVALNHQREVIDKTRTVNKAMGALVSHTAEEMQAGVRELGDTHDFDPDAFKEKLQAVYACLDDADQRKANAVARLEEAARALQEAQSSRPGTPGT